MIRNGSSTTYSARRKAMAPTWIWPASPCITALPAGCFLSAKNVATVATRPMASAYRVRESIMVSVGERVGRSAAVEAGHGDLDALGEPALDRFGHRVEQCVELSPFFLAKSAQHKVGDVVVLRRFGAYP